MAQVIKNIFNFQGQNLTIHFTLIALQMYSNSLRLQQNKSKNHSNYMNKHNNVKRDQMQELAKFSHHSIFVLIQEWHHYTIPTFSFHNLKKLLSLLSFIIFLLLKFLLQI